MKLSALRTSVSQRWMHTLPVGGECEKDEKEPKLIARKMCAMLGDINRQVIKIRKGAVVNCYTCHRGSNKPLLSPSPQ